MNNLRCNTCDHESHHHGESGCQFATCSCDEFKAKKEKEEITSRQNTATQNTREKLEKWEVNPKAFKKKSSMDVKQESKQRRQSSQSEIWDEVEANWVKVDELIDDHEYEKAIVELNIILEKKFENISAWIKKGRIYVELKEYHTAIICYETALILDNGVSKKFDKKNYEILNLIAIAHRHNDDHLEAINFCKKSLEIKEDFTPALSELAFNYREIKAYELSIEQYTKYLEIDKNNVDALDELGYNLEQLEKWDEAIDCYNKSKQVENKDPNDVYADKHLAKCYLAKKDFEHAELLINNEKILQNQNAYSYEVRGEIYKKQEKYAEAITNYEKEIMYKLSERFDALFDLGYCHAQIKNYHIALEYYKAYVTKSGLTDAVAQNLGYVLSRLGLNQEALEWYDKGLNIVPNHLELLNNKSIVCWNLNQYSNALECYNKMLQNEPENLWFLNKKANVLIKLEKFVEAIEIWNSMQLETLKENDPPKEMILNNIGWAYVKMGEFENDVKYFEKGLKYVDDALRINSKEDYIVDSKCHALNFLHKHKEAAEWFEKKYQITKNEYDRLWSGVCIQDWGKQEDDLIIKEKIFNQSLEIFDSIIQNDPTYSYAFFNKGYTYLLLKKYEEAITWTQKAIELNSDAAIFWRQLGIIHKDKNNSNLAIICFDTAIKIEEEPLALKNKGEVLYNINKYTEAIDCFEKSLKIVFDIDVVLQKSNALHMMEEFTQAIECYDKVLEIEPNNDTALSNKGNTLRAMKKYEESLKYLNKSIELDPLDFYNFDTKVILYQDWEKYEESLEVLHHTLREFPDQEEKILNHFITTYKKMDNHEMVKEYKEKLQKLKDLK